MKIVGMVANAFVFVICTGLCGRYIEKRDWDKSVFWFLLALATILYAVKSMPPF
jgi:hypothetical protein